jgi:hypothetical protein
MSQDTVNRLTHQAPSLGSVRSLHQKLVIIGMGVANVRHDGQSHRGVIQSPPGSRTPHPSAPAQRRVPGDLFGLTRRAAGIPLTNRLVQPERKFRILFLEAFGGASPQGRPFRRISQKFGLRSRDGAFAGEQTLPFVAFARPAEPHDHRRQWAVLARSPGERGISPGQELQVAKRFEASAGRC